MLVLGSTLEELRHAYAKRFGVSGINPQMNIDDLIADPDRNDLILRHLAERLAPWRAAPESRTLSADSEPQREPEPEPAELELYPAAPLPAVSATSPSPRSVVVHGYDERRFGSQQVLGELLQREKVKQGRRRWSLSRFCVHKLR